jgi:hypothetical protein
LVVMVAIATNANKYFFMVLFIFGVILLFVDQIDDGVILNLRPVFLDSL